MRWLRRLAIALLGTVLLVTLLGAGSVMSVKMTNSRDEDAFLRTLASCCRYDHKAIFKPADKGDLIASGDRRAHGYESSRIRGGAVARSTLWTE